MYGEITLSSLVRKLKNNLIYATSLFLAWHMNTVDEFLIQVTLDLIKLDSRLKPTLYNARFFSHFHPVQLTCMKFTNGVFKESVSW